jgi:hypothetical protein
MTFLAFLKQKLLKKKFLIKVSKFALALIKNGRLTLQNFMFFSNYVSCSDNKKNIQLGSVQH